MTRIIAAVQARMGSTRLPGKVLLEIEGLPLVLWTMAGIRAVPGVDEVVAAVSTDDEDDELAAVLAEAGYPVHRGPGRDVLTRFWGAVEPYEPDLVVRATSDCPFPDATVIARQIERLRAEGLDYIGIKGWPVGIAGEVARAEALGIAAREATETNHREHVMPYLYANPDRFRIGAAPPTGPIPPGRYAVDTAEDLEFIRAIARRIGSARPVTLDELGAIVAAEPDLLDLNRGVHQKTWHDAQA